MSYDTFPSIITPESAEWGMAANSMVHTSPLSGSEDILELSGAKWFVTLAFSDYTRAEAAALEAFIFSRRGRAKFFYLWNHARPTIRGSGAGAPVVNGAGQLGGSLATAGWTPNAAGVLLPGDYIGVGGELKIVPVRVDADATGKAVVPVEPPQRYAPANGSAIVLTEPKALFRLIDDRQILNHLASLTSFTVGAIETF